MHGIIFSNLKDFVVEEFDLETWHAIQSAAGVENKLYIPVTEYSDEELLALVEASVELAGIDADTLQREFGKYLFPKLRDTYGVHVDGDWSGLELLANVETYIHEALRAKQLSEFTPPGLGVRRVDDDRIVLTYGSDRGLCSVAEGLILGVGDHYGEQYAVRERQCQHRGADRCEFFIKRQGT